LIRGERVFERLSTGQSRVDGIGQELGVPDRVRDALGQDGVFVVAGVADERPPGPCD
jgi:hypothetical protein